jgi:hypothetical protein
VNIAGTAIDPGSDIEWCEVQQFPGTAGQAYYVNAIDFWKAPFSHHMFLSAVKRGSAAETAASALGVGNKTQCVNASGAFGDGTVTIGGAAKSEQSVHYPPGVGLVFYGGQKLLFDYHYYNTSESTVKAQAGANFHLVSEADVKKVAHIFGVMNIGIEIPPEGTAGFQTECRFNHDVMVGGVLRHTHRWGTTFKVWTVDTQDQPELLWTSDDWQNDIEFQFSEPHLMKAGEAFRYECDYRNTEARTLRFGTKATDEMCNLFGAWWVVNEGDDPGPQNCVIDKTDPDGIARGDAGDTGALNAVSE